jgi:hypothetical protein
VVLSNGQVSEQGALHWSWTVLLLDRLWLHTCQAFTQRLSANGQMSADGQVSDQGGPAPVSAWFIALCPGSYDL